MCDFPSGAITKHGKAIVWTNNSETDDFSLIQFIFYLFVCGLSIKACLVKKKKTLSSVFVFYFWLSTLSHITSYIYILWIIKKERKSY